MMLKMQQERVVRNLETMRLHNENRKDAARREEDRKNEAARSEEERKKKSTRREEARPEILYDEYIVHISHRSFY